jgi:hypothetical protein
MEGVACQEEKNQKTCRDLALCEITKKDGQRGTFKDRANEKGRWIIENRHPKPLSDSIQDQVKQMINEVARKKTKTSF